MRQVGVKSLLWSLPILAMLLYVACMPWMELRCSDEAIYATIAREIAESHDFIHLTFQHQPINVFPLYPWLVFFCSLFHLPSEIAVRLPSVLAVFGMAVGAFLVARRHRDVNAGLSAAAIVLTSYGVMRIGIVAQGETLHAALLSGAWFTWYAFGPIKHKWNCAWFLALGMIFLDFLNVGLRGVVLFYLPFLFTNIRPRARRLLRSREHLRCLVCFALVGYFWLILGCKQPLLGWYASVGPLSSSAAPEGFFHHLFLFPCRCFCDMLPWAFFLWIPFCLDLRPLEPSSSICGFLRPAVLCTFIAYWLLPGHSSLLVLAALPPMAVMISFTLPIVLHRYERFWRKVGWVGTIAAMLMLCHAIVYWGWIGIGKITFPDWTPCRIPWGTAFVVILVLAFAFVALCIWGHRASTLGMAWIATGLRMGFVAVVGLSAYLTMGNRQYVASQLIPQKTSANSYALKGDDQEENCLDIKEIYFIADDDSCPAQLFYSGFPIRRVQKSEQLPREKEFYLVAESQPVFPGWKWVKMNGPVDFHLHRVLEPSPLHPTWDMFSWNFKGRECRRRELRPEEFPACGRKNYEPLFFNLYRGSWMKDSGLPANSH